MTELPEGYTLRPPDEDDLEAVTAMLVASDMALFGESGATPEGLDADWSMPRFDLERDAWLIIAPDDRVAGTGWVWDPQPHERFESNLTVHPEHAGHQLGTLLLELIEDRACQKAAWAPPEVAVMLHSWSGTANRRKIDLFLRSGFVKIAEFYRMEIDIREPQPVADPPAGIAVRTFRLGRDDAAVHAVMLEAFAGERREIPETVENWRETSFGYERFDPDLWFVAWDGDEVAGALLGYDEPAMGYVDELGVRGAWRGKGVATALLLHAFAAFREHGQRKVVLGVESTNPTGATLLYEHVGMSVKRRVDYFEKELRPALGARPVRP